MWLIDRTWKPREGWSRPALTVEDNQHHHDTSQETPGGIIMAVRHTTRTPTSFTRVHDPVPKPATRITQDFAAAMAQGRRPVPFRTRKLSPGTAMVLCPRGHGRVAHRRNHTSTGPRTGTTGPGSSHTHTTHPQATRPSLGVIIDKSVQSAQYAVYAAHHIQELIAWTRSTPGTMRV